MRPGERREAPGGLSAPSSPVRSRRPRSALIRIALAAVLLGAVAYAVTDIIPGSGGRLDHARLGWIALAVAVEAAALLAYALLFDGVFSPGVPELTFVRSAQIAIGELGAFAVVPTGAGGPVLRVWALLASGLEFELMMIRSVIHAVIFNLPYIAVASVLGLAVLLGVGPGKAPAAVALAPLGVVALTVIVAAGLTAFARRTHASPRGRWQRYGLAIVQAVPEGLARVPRSLRKPGLILSATGYWAGDCGVLVLAFAAVHGSPSLGVVVLAYLLGQLGNALPLPGGVGGVEPLMLGVFTASGVDLGLAAAAVVLYRFVSLGLQAVTGTVAVATLTPVLRAGAIRWPEV